MRNSLDRLNAHPEVDTAGPVSSPHPNEDLEELIIIWKNDSPDAPITPERAKELRDFIEAVKREYGLQWPEENFPFVSNLC